MYCFKSHDNKSNFYLNSTYAMDDKFWIQMSYFSNKVKQTLAGLARLHGKYIDLRTQCWLILKHAEKVLFLLMEKQLNFPTAILPK